MRFVHSGESDLLQKNIEEEKNKTLGRVWLRRAAYNRTAVAHRKRVNKKKETTDLQ